MMETKMCEQQVSINDRIGNIGSPSGVARGIFSDNNQDKGELNPLGSVEQTATSRMPFGQHVGHFSLWM